MPAHAAGVEAGAPFPSNLLTVPDPTQITGVRVSLPLPNCATNPSDCADVAVLNRLDGFNVQPRLSIPFSAPIDLATVSSATVRLYALDCLACAPIGIDQAVWEPAATTLHAEPAEQLEQDETYLLVATTGIHSSDGKPLDRSSFLRDLNFGQTKDEHAKLYRTALRGALHATGTFTEAAAASLFTTQSITADLEKIRAQLDASSPAPAQVTASFPRSQITAIAWNRQTTTSGPLAQSFLPVPALDVFPGSVGRVVFGAYDSPDYETAAKVIPATGTLTGSPQPQGTNRISFTLFLPAGSEPASGWPVVIFGHGFTDSKQGSPWAVASSLARFGLASVAINVVGHGGGAGGNLTILTPTGPTVIPGRRAGHRPGRQRDDRLDRGRQRGAARHARLESRRPATDRRRPDAARSRDPGRASTSTETAAPTSTHRASPTPASPSAGSTASTSSRSSPTSWRAWRTCPADRSSRSRGFHPASGRSSGSR